MSRAEIEAVLRAHDEAWARMDLTAVAALWDPDDPGTTYLGDECAEPVVGPEAMARHWGRMGTRLQGAKLTSELRSLAPAGADVVTVLTAVAWSYCGVESDEWQTGHSWVAAVLRRTDAGWRYVHSMERLADSA